ncbi:hypothetical protein LZ32DRAFT_669311 [Colletotrichum eremochloae]|nr:hypothetical protein LZ32DRAFT_669311 [Colletotrichum eremochloae]
MGAACSSHANCYADNPTDADVMGIGVLLAFVVPVLLSYFIVYLAYITGDAFDAHQYTEIDKRILQRLKGPKWLKRLQRQRPVLASIRNTKYRQIILGLSDQLLVTSFGILIAVYVQTCSMSLLCFQVSEELAHLVSGVHMNCLLALGSYFEEHKRQRWVRIWLMAFLLVFVLTTTFLVYLTYYNDEWETIACAIRHYETDWPYLFVTWLAFCWWIASGFRKSICHFRDSRSEFLRVESLAHWALNAVYRHGASREDLKECCLLRQRSPKQPWRVRVPIMARVIAMDFWQSLIFVTIRNLSYTVRGLYAIVEILVYAQIDYTPLLEPKFGQILPLVMLIVLLLNIMEANGSPTETDRQIDADSTETGELTLVPPERIRQRTNEQVAPPKRQVTGFEDHRQAGAEAFMSGGIPRQRTGGTVREQILHANRETNRVDTLEIEAGVSLHPNFHHFGEAISDRGSDTRFDLAAIVYKDTPKWVIKLVFFAVLAAIVGFFYSLVEYFNQTVIAVCALNLLYQLWHICKGFWRFWMFRRKARREVRGGQPAST